MCYDLVKLTTPSVFAGLMNTPNLTTYIIRIKRMASDTGLHKFIVREMFYIIELLFSFAVKVPRKYMFLYMS